MADPKKHDPTRSVPETGEHHQSGQEPEERPPFVPPDPSGRAKRGSEFRDADLHDAPVDDLDDHIPD
jgi:hypothetical protein